MSSPMKESRKRKPRNAIRLFIGYEDDADELVKKFVQMKKRYEFQNTVDLFSWLIELGEQAGKPPTNIAKKTKLSTSAPTTKLPPQDIQTVTVVNKTSRRKQQNPLKANLVNTKSIRETSDEENDERNGTDAMQHSDNDENDDDYGDDNGELDLENDGGGNYTNGIGDQQTPVVLPE